MTRTACFVTWRVLFSQNGTEWYAYDESKEGCVKRMCYVSKENFTKGICPTPIKVNPCVPDLTQCEKCENRTIVKDVCGCDKVECRKFGLEFDFKGLTDVERRSSLCAQRKCFHCIFRELQTGAFTIPSSMRIATGLSWIGLKWTWIKLTVKLNWPNLNWRIGLNWTWIKLNLNLN